MRRFIAILLTLLCSISIEAQDVGIRLHTLIDFGQKLNDIQAFRSVEGSESIIAIPFHEPTGRNSFGRVLFINLETAELKYKMEFSENDGYMVLKTKYKDEFITDCRKMTGKSNYLYTYDYIDNGNEVREITKEDFNSFLNEVIRPRGGIYGHINTLGTKYTFFPVAWPDDLEADDLLLQKIAQDDSRNMDWELIDRSYVCLMDPFYSDGNVSTTIPYDFRNLKDEVLFKLPFVMAPGGDEDSGVSSGNLIELMKDGKRILISGHAYSHDMFPELIGKVENERRQYVWIYDIVDSKTWSEMSMIKAKHIILKSDLSGILEVRDLNPDRYSIKPGMRRVYGLFGEITTDRLNLRKDPKISSPVLMLMTRESVWNGRFMILDRTKDKEKIGDMEDYWYKIIFTYPRGYIGWVYGAYIKFIDKLAPGIETVDF